MEKIENYLDGFEIALYQIDRIRIEEIINQAKELFQPIQIANVLITPTLQKIGEKWDDGSVGLAQIYMAAKICEDVIDKLISFKEIEIKDHPKIGIVVFEDYHELGKRTIQMYLHNSGYNIIDYGAGIVSEDLLRNVKRDNIELLFISTLMLRSALRIKDFIDKKNEAELNIKIIVGGAPFNFDTELWKVVGADAYGRNPSDVLHLLSEFIRGELNE